MSSDGQAEALDPEPQSPPAQPEHQQQETQPQATQPPASAPLREDMLQNAVAFLTHPKVKDSPESTKRSFLDRKGLTTAEVDEAFKRVPAQLTTITAPPPPTATPVQGLSGLVTYQGQPQQQQQQQYPQGTIVPQPPPGYSLVPSSAQQGSGLIPAQHQLPQQSPQEPVRWSQVVLGIGILATGIYALKSLVFPYVHNAYQSWSAKAKAHREAQEQQQQALSELIVTLNACKKEMSTNAERMGEILKAMQAQQADQAAASQRAESSSVDISHELAGLRAALHQLKQKPHAILPPTANDGRASNHTLDDYDDAGFGAYTMGPSGARNRWGMQISSPAAALGSKHVHPYQPASPEDSPTASPSRSSMQPRVFPGGFDGVLPLPGGYRGGYRDQAQLYSAGKPGSTVSTLQGQQQQDAPPASHAVGHPAVASATAAQPTYPSSFVEVMEMVSKGITPPNVRSDINDTPPDPNRTPSESRMPHRSKPWESGAATSEPVLPLSPQKAASSSLTPTPYSPSLPWHSSPPTGHSSVEHAAAPPPHNSPLPAEVHAALGSNAQGNSPLVSASPATGNRAGALSGNGLVHSSQEWLGASSPEVPRGSGALPPPSVTSDLEQASSPQQGMQGSKLNVAAEPYAPIHQALAATNGDVVKQAEQQAGSSSNRNPIFQGLQREVGTAGAQDEGASASSSSSSSSGHKQQQQGTPQPAGVLTPASSSRASILKPNPDWKPPPPPPATILKPKKATVPPPTHPSPAEGIGAEKTPANKAEQEGIAGGEVGVPGAESQVPVNGAAREMATNASEQ